ncbi:unnamed protein product [Sphenostylis stenocarpa]|uniref:Uncharacterized protein n=1 Tax=Sphenostylis stenocarpa TaxID=92480 RepID=A0AA87B9T3_9FABA|nr:unnamed protein product [Sphenostylis stenocarpa]
MRKAHQRTNTRGKYLATIFSISFTCPFRDMMMSIENDKFLRITDSHQPIQVMNED